MKSYIYLLVAVFLGISQSNLKGQTSFDIDLPNRLPTDLVLNNSEVKTYRIITDYLDYDLKGNFSAKKRVAGDFTIGLPGDTVRWNNISLSNSADLEGDFPKGEVQQYMENFSYIQDENILSQAFFKDIPQADILIRNLIWDVAGLNWFAYWNWDNLELNKPYGDNNINNQELDLSGQGTFENRNAEITWIGVTKQNDETCAILKYITMNNPLTVKLENMNMTGRSHYWGEIYVSLEDKEIEMATLLEDVVTDVSLEGQPNNILGYTVRKITLTKTN